jgi:hypothetical protein
MMFPPSVVNAAWIRQKGRCAKCGKKLVRVNQDRGIEGAWHAHPRLPDGSGGTDTIENCVIFCTNLPDCHYNIGHGGMSSDYYASLSNDELPYIN